MGSQEERINHLDCGFCLKGKITVELKHEFLVHITISDDFQISDTLSFILFFSPNIISYLIYELKEVLFQMKAKSISWNPDVATQLLLASDDDATPMAQVWDLRYANAPLKTLEGHQRGILATAWCVQDSSLLMTAAKDNK